MGFSTDNKGGIPLINAFENLGGAILSGDASAPEFHNYVFIEADQGARVVKGSLNHSHTTIFASAAIPKPALLNKQVVNSAKKEKN